MIVKFFKRGKGTGSGPVEYLLGRNYDRDGATLLSGDPDITRGLIDNLKFAKRYTSGVLSFEEATISDEVKQEMMASFEETILAGMDGRVDVLWVEHNDKGRIELNFVIPNVDLATGKRFQPYYDRNDRGLVDAWKNIQNHEYGFTDPNDPVKQQTLTTVNNLPKSAKAIQDLIHKGVNDLVLSGEVQSRDDIISALNTAGFEVARQTKTSISIKNPDGKRNIRLQGAFYEQSFRYGQGLRERVEQAQEKHKRTARERYQQQQQEYQESLAKRRAYFNERYQELPVESPPELIQAHMDSLSSDGGYPSNRVSIESLLGRDDKEQASRLGDSEPSNRKAEQSDEYSARGAKSTGRNSKEADPSQTDKRNSLPSPASRKKLRNEAVQVQEIHVLQDNKGLTNDSSTIINQLIKRARQLAAKANRRATRLYKHIVESSYKARDRAGSFDDSINQLQQASESIRRKVISGDAGNKNKY